MGKRKQECPRKLAETMSEVSKLESIVKKLKTNPVIVPQKPVPTPEVELSASTLPPAQQQQQQENTPIPITAPVVTVPRNSAPVQEYTHQQRFTEIQPLDLRLPKLPTNNHDPPVLLPASSWPMTAGTSSSPAPAPSMSALDLSPALISAPGKCRPVTPIPVQQELPALARPTAPATSFQELSAKLEQYFNTGIAASKFPRKMVRGQDMWMQDVEQKRRILKCLKCGCSYNTLAELAKHIKKTGHHTSELPAFSAEIQRTHPVYSRLSGVRPEKLSAGRADAPSSGNTYHQASREPDRVSRGPSAFRPVHQSPIVEPAKQRTFSSFLPSLQHSQGKNQKTIPREAGSLQNYASPEFRRPPPRHSVSDMLREEPNGHNGFFHGASVIRRDHDHRRTSRPSQEKYVPVLRSSVEGEKRARNISPVSVVPLLDGGNIKKEISEVSIKHEPKVDFNAVEDRPKVPQPSANSLSESSPLFALKKFLDFGIPRLKPASIDGGRI